ncbi:BNR repeat-containing protein [Steroidobacter sp. S1-65]|uniref:BNR repeat-containing protein n=1 Tax=Steroidobacter gossypii TaxID=2805490 RepID=A0ABS1WWT3_9GAMM|nr:BNR repeat-containing protein [Steroidobacter gossypii]MBM0105442.1 BNR repeat-containing protein [Steroidobacter gossypii]
MDSRTRRSVSRSRLLAVVACFVAASMAVHARADEVHARLLTIGPAYSGSSVNVVANRRHSLFTHGRMQFAAYYDNDHHLVLGRRSLDGGEWITQRTAFKGNVKDAHNSISIAVDGAGILHVGWDQHDNPLNYARGVRPLELELARVPYMTGVAETRVSYPEFHLLGDGDLLFLYRDGQSGRGRLVLNRYSVRQRAWRTVQSNLIDGEGQRSPYWNLTVDSGGGVHLAWLWRDTPDVATNHDLAYAFSADGGASWRSSERAALTMPITVAADAYVAKIPMRHNLMNPPWIATDARGQPYIVSYWSDAPDSPAQFRVVYRSKDSWQTETITRRTETFALAGAGTRRPPISRGVLVVENTIDSAPAAHLVYRDDAAGGALLMSTDRLGSAEWRQRQLTRTSPGAWEPTLDPVQWQRYQQLHLLMQSVEQRDGNDAEDAGTAAAEIATLMIDPRVDQAR